MKKMLFLFLLSPSVWASSITLEDFDQQKLADLVSQLPLMLRQRSVISISRPAHGAEVTSIFPKEKGAFQFTCQSQYFNSEYASFGKCHVEIDLHHPDLEKNYNEIKIILKGIPEARGLYETIAFGKPTKKYYSFGRDPGTTFEGTNGNVFHYRFSCSVSSCELRFSELRLKN